MKEVDITTHYLYIFGLRPNYREGIQPHPSAENLIKDLLKMALPTSILIHQKADRMKTTVTEN